jgi:hypothetical protein
MTSITYVLFYVAMLFFIASITTEHKYQWVEYGLVISSVLTLLSALFFMLLEMMYKQIGI